MTWDLGRLDEALNRKVGKIPATPCVSEHKAEEAA